MVEASRIAKTLTDKPTQRRSLEKYRHRWKRIIRMDHRETDGSVSS